MTDAVIDSRRCPLCGGANACAMAESKSKCWCFEMSFPPELFEKIPEEARGRACVCHACASGTRTPAERLQQVEELMRRQ